MEHILKQLNVLATSGVLTIQSIFDHNKVVSLFKSLFKLIIEIIMLAIPLYLALQVFQIAYDGKMMVSYECSQNEYECRF